MRHKLRSMIHKPNIQRSKGDYNPQMILYDTLIKFYAAQNYVL